ncbi:glutathione peroxidase 7 [Ovis canadensis]
MHPGTRGNLTETNSDLGDQNPETTAGVGEGARSPSLLQYRWGDRGPEPGAPPPAGKKGARPPWRAAWRRGRPPPASRPRCACAPCPASALATPPAAEPVMVAARAAAWLLLAAAACAPREQDFYDFKAVNIRGKLVSLEKYRGSVSLVVNVASECGFTDQHYRALQQLQRDLGPHHFNVLAFPCNQFGQQEPDSNKEIESFARRTYSVSFPMFSKIAVTGTGAHPAFKYLTETSGKEPTWNFWKYLVAPDGKVVGAWDPTVSVEEIRPQVTALVRKLILKKREDL